ncbi:MAG: hypothetical protein KDE33_25370, partial [Bacteroidetes bacterium]|nr:hypothetical protein [Bacteroidota bacterium]
YDLIIGKRNKRSDNLYRRLNSKMYNLVISLLARKKITDVNSIVLFKSEILKNLNLKSTSAFINAEFILKALEKNYKFIEVPIIHQSRKHGRGSGGKWSVIKKVIKDVIKYMFS